MADFVTVDRWNRFSVDQVLTPTVFSDISPPELQSHANELFPSGVSRHGEEYFLRSSSRANVASPVIELLMEYVRRASFPERPSRFTSWFGVDSVEEARQFRSRFCGGEGRLCRVSTDNFFRANMSLLTVGQSTLVSSWFAHVYWRGEAGPRAPFWEYLLSAPVRVLEVIPESADERGA